MNEPTNAALEDRLREHFDRRTRGLPQHGPGLDVSTTPGHSSVTTTRSPWATGLMAVAAVAALVAAGAVVLQRAPDSDSEIVSATVPSGPITAPITGPGDASVGVLEPVETLPESGDVSDTPVTVAATAPVDWYRFAPDLDVSWYLDPSGTEPSMFCWRTPAVDAPQCSVDAIGSVVVPLVVPTAGGQTLVLGGSPQPDGELAIELDDGTTLSAPQIADDVIDWGVARFAVPADRRIVGIDGMPFDVPPEVVPTGTFCDVMAGLAGERPESYVGSAEQISDIVELLAASPDAIEGDVRRFLAFVESGFIDSANDPTSNETANWPADVQESIADIQAYAAETCP